MSPVATNNVHYASPVRFPLATALAAVRARRPLDELQGWLPPSATACLRSEGEQQRRFARWPGAVERAAEIAAMLRLRPPSGPPRAPRLPSAHRPHRADLARRAGPPGATDRYGPREDERVSGSWEHLDHELAVIDALGFPGYFLIV